MSTVLFFSKLYLNTNLYVIIYFTEVDKMKLVKSYLIEIATFVVTIMLFLFIVSLVFTYTKIEDRFIDSGIFLSMAISAFISSFVLCKMIKKKGLVHGVIVNIISVLIIFIISCILNNNISITNTLGIYISICCLSGIVGGILGVNV